MRQMKNTATDPFSGGRNFGNHYSARKWNVVPVTSTIETQYATAIGTGIAQKHHGGTGLTIVTGGDAGTAEGEFASCLTWATIPNQELPMLIVVTNNSYGISTPACQVQHEGLISRRAQAFGIKTFTIDGNDVEESYLAIEEATSYIRTERRPAFIEARVSRLYGHSSASGANFHPEEEDCLVVFESQLEEQGVLKRDAMDALREKYTKEMIEISKKVKAEPMPDPSSIYDYVYWQQKGKYW